LPERGASPGSTRQASCPGGVAGGKLAGIFTPSIFYVAGSDSRLTNRYDMIRTLALKKAR
jgi:hypothetical protein